MVSLTVEWYRVFDVETLKFDQNKMEVEMSKNDLWKETVRLFATIR